MDIKIFENGTYGLNSLMSSCKVRAMEIHSGNWTLITSYHVAKIFFHIDNCIDVAC